MACATYPRKWLQATRFTCTREGCSGDTNCVLSTSAFHKLALALMIDVRNCEHASISATPWLQVPAPAGAKPFILLSGDDSGVADLLTPSATTEWSYEVTRVANVSDTKVLHHCNSVVCRTQGSCSLLVTMPSRICRIAKLASQAGGTVGSPAIADTDGDGYVEFVVPLYSDSLVKVFTFAPQNRVK